MLYVKYNVGYILLTTYLLHIPAQGKPNPHVTYGPIFCIAITLSPIFCLINLKHSNHRVLNALRNIFFHSLAIKS